MTDRDIIQEIAESDPLVRAYDNSGAPFIICHHCENGYHFAKNADHAPDCRWVYCVEQMKEREDE